MTSVNFIPSGRVEYGEWNMAPYSTVALHTFSMEQVYSCGISNVYLYEYILYHAYLCALARHYVYIISTWICTHTCTRTLTSSHMCTHTLKLHIHMYPQADTTNNVGFAIGSLVVFGYSFLLASFIVLPVTEKETKVQLCVCTRVCI